jgi:hypothetical protein
MERDESDNPVARPERCGLRHIVQGDAAVIEGSTDIAPDRLVWLDRNVMTPNSWER